MQVVPGAENPFNHHPSPLQAGCKLQATGRCHDAALAFEAAGMVSLSLHVLQLQCTASYCFSTRLVDMPCRHALSVCLYACVQEALEGKTLVWQLLYVSCLCLFPPPPAPPPPPSPPSPPPPTQAAAQSCPNSVQSNCKRADSVVMNYSSASL